MEVWSPRNEAHKPNLCKPIRSRFESLKASSDKVLFRSTGGLQLRSFTCQLLLLLIEYFSNYQISKPRGKEEISAAPPRTDGSVGTAVVRVNEDRNLRVSDGLKGDFVS